MDAVKLMGEMGDGRGDKEQNSLGCAKLVVCNARHNPFMAGAFRRLRRPMRSSTWA